MDLTPPPSDLTASSYDDLISLIQAHALKEGYAVVKRRSNKDRTGETDKVWVRCTRGGKIRETSGQKRKHRTSRANECPFSCILKLDKRQKIWRMRIKETEHNHPSAKRVAHAVHRVAATTSEVEAMIITQSADRATPGDILHKLNKGHEEDPIWKTRDIYNVKWNVRHRMLGPLTPTQALLRWLHDDDEWYIRLLKDPNDRVTYLFFTRTSYQEMLKENWEVVIMDNTYKTNRYKLPLLIIIGTNALGGLFYVAFYFIAKEEEEDFLWVL